MYNNMLLKFPKTTTVPSNFKFKFYEVKYCPGSNAVVQELIELGQSAETRVPKSLLSIAQISTHTLR